MRSIRLAFSFLVLSLSHSVIKGQTDTTVTIDDGISLHVVYHLAQVDKPMVVLQAGARSHAGIWSSLIPLLMEAGYSFLAYDRPGLGESSPVDGNRDGIAIAAELKRLLLKLRIDQKLILVGHSMGGVYQAIYNDLNPDKVNGLVMIDSPNGSWEPGLRSCLSSEQNAQRDSSLTAMRASLPETVRDEYEGAKSSFDTMEGMQLQNQLVIISGGAQSWPQGYDGACLSETWKRVQLGLNSLRANAQHLVSESSGHGIPHQDPQIIMKTIASIKQR